MSNAISQSLMVRFISFHLIKSMGNSCTFYTQGQKNNSWFLKKIYVERLREFLVAFSCNILTLKGLKKSSKSVDIAKKM